MAPSLGFQGRSRVVISHGDVCRDLEGAGRSTDRSDAVSRTSSRGDIRSAGDLVDVRSLRELEALHPGAFSACTFRPRDDRTVVVYSPLNSVARRNSDLAHELAHIILWPTKLTFASNGSATLSYCLLTPIKKRKQRGCPMPSSSAAPACFDPAARAIGSGYRQAAACQRAMVTYRINVTGAMRQRHRAQSARQPARVVRR